MKFIHGYKIYRTKHAVPGRCKWQTHLMKIFSNGQVKAVPELLLTLIYLRKEVNTSVVDGSFPDLIVQKFVVNKNQFMTHVSHWLFTLNP